MRRRQYRASERERARALVCERESTQTHKHRAGTETHKQTHTKMFQYGERRASGPRVSCFTLSLFLSLSHTLTLSLTHQYSYQNGEAGSAAGSKAAKKASPPGIWPFRRARGGVPAPPLSLLLLILYCITLHYNIMPIRYPAGPVDSAQI